MLHAKHGLEQSEVGKEIAENMSISQALAAKQAELVKAPFECMPALSLIPRLVCNRPHPDCDD
jgi:hypothetical protein